MTSLQSVLYKIQLRNVYTDNIQSNSVFGITKIEICDDFLQT